jgi:hypothetical protein
LIPDSAKRGIDMLWQEPEGLECQLRTTRTTRSLLMCCCEHFQTRQVTVQVS